MVKVIVLHFDKVATPGLGHALQKRIGNHGLLKLMDALKDAVLFVHWQAFDFFDDLICSHGPMVRKLLYCKYLVEHSGFEPLTSSMPLKRSTN